MNAQSRVTSRCGVVIPPVLLRGMLPLFSIMTLCLKNVFICERHFDDEFLKKNGKLSRFSMEKNPVPTILPGHKKSEHGRKDPALTHLCPDYYFFFVVFRDIA